MNETVDTARQIQSLERIQVLCSTLSEGYYAFHAAVSVVADPRAKEILPEKGSRHVVPVGRIKGDDFTIEYDAAYYLERAATQGDDYGRMWLAGAILNLRNEIERAGIPRTPECEWLRHVRNAVAHGNTFDIRYPDDLARHPAYVAGLYGDGSRNDDERGYEIRSELNGAPCLYEFIGEAELASTFHTIASHLALERKSLTEELA